MTAAATTTTATIRTTAAREAPSHPAESKCQSKKDFLSGKKTNPRIPTYESFSINTELKLKKNIGKRTKL